MIWISRNVLGDSVLPFSDLDSEGPNYKNSLLLIQEQNKKF